DLLATAKEQGFDEIICLNSDGEISEGAVSNFIFRIDGKWITSPLSSGVLPGVQRAIVIERCGVGVQAISSSDMA
ncbi:MAG: aminotransferase class IV, partial [Burkholderiaceae bacterium]|nr:aminotransferase class IV [Burkholderiaceae bacterium]